MTKKKDKPSATDLIENPLIDVDMGPDLPEMGDTPFDKTYSALTTTGGKILEMMTRTTPKLAQAIGVGHTMTYNFHSRYIQSKLDTLMRIHVSMGGQGRAEMVQSLQSGSGVPGEFYDQGNPTLHSFVDVDGDEDGGDGS